MKRRKVRYFYRKNSVVFANFISCAIHYSDEGSVMYLMVCKKTITPLYILTKSSRRLFLTLYVFFFSLSLNFSFVKRSGMKNCIEEEILRFTIKAEFFTCVKNKKNRSIKTDKFNYLINILFQIISLSK